MKRPLSCNMRIDYDFVLLVRSTACCVSSASTPVSNDAETSCRPSPHPPCVGFLHLERTIVNSTEGNYRITYQAVFTRYKVKAPTRQLQSIPIAVSCRIGKQHQLNRPCHPMSKQKTPDKLPFLVGYRSPFLRHAGHLTFRFTVDSIKQAMSAWSVENPTCSVPDS